MGQKTVLLICTAAVLLFSGYILFYKLGNEPFQDYDEATYAEITHESIEHGDPSTLTFLNQPFYRKPPLLFWMTSASQHVFRDVEFADRFPSALVALVAIVIVGLICVETGASVWAALAAAAMLATTAGWMEFARDVRFDNLVALFDVAAFYAGIRATRDSRWFLMVGIALALAVLSKSVVALFGGIAVLIFLICERAFSKALRDKHFWFGIGTFLLVAAPWHIYMTFAHGMTFWHEYLGIEVFERAGTNLFAGGGNPTNAQYGEYLMEFAAPWTKGFIITLIATPLLLRSFSSRMRSVYIAALAAALSVVVVAFIAKTKSYGYVMPLFPFLAVVVALAGWQLWHWLEGNGKVKARAHVPRISTFQSIFIGVVVIVFAYAAALTRYEALHLDPYYSWELSQAYEEHAVASIIQVAPNPEVYTYGGYDFLGNIYYYSGIPDTPYQYIFLWSASSTPSATSTAFILATSSLTTLSTSFPHYRFIQNYSGKFVSLFTVTAAR